MKKHIAIITAAALLVSGITYTSCNSPEDKVENAQEKVENAQENVDQAQQDLAKANEQYLVEIENYRKQTLDRSEANDRAIEEYRTKIDMQKKEARAEYKKKLAELEDRNREMKRKMTDYKDEGKDKWETFKAEFNHDMDELGKSFDDFRTNNVK